VFSIRTIVHWLKCRAASRQLCNACVISFLRLLVFGDLDKYTIIRAVQPDFKPLICYNYPDNLPDISAYRTIVKSQPTAM